jgi:hypothetical protein
MASMMATHGSAYERATLQMPRLYWAVRAQDGRTTGRCQPAYGVCQEEILVQRAASGDLETMLMDEVARALGRGEIPGEFRVARPMEPDFTLTPDMRVFERPASLNPSPRQSFPRLVGAEPLRPACARGGDPKGQAAALSVWDPDDVYGDPDALARQRRRTMTLAIAAGVAAALALAGFVLFM